MTAKEYLLQIRAIKTQIQIITEEITELQAKLGAQGISYDREPSGTAGDDERQAHLIYRLIEKKDKLYEEQIALLNAEHEIREKLFTLRDGKEIQVLYLRYFKLMKYNDIAEQMHYSERRIRELHTFGLMDLQEKL